MPLDPVQTIVSNYLSAQLASKEQALRSAGDLPEMQAKISTEISELANLTRRWFIPPQPPLPLQHHRGIQIKAALESFGFTIYRKNHWPSVYGNENTQVKIISELLSRSYPSKPLSAHLRKRNGFLSIGLHDLRFDPEILMLMSRKQPLPYLIDHLSQPGLWTAILERDLNISAINLSVNNLSKPIIYLRLKCIEQLELPLSK